MRQLGNFSRLIIRLLIGLLPILLIVLLHTPFTHAEQALSDAPYLYYYSNEVRAIIVERADGTDSRILGDGLASTGYYDNLIDAGWSPSGQWLAWTANGRGCEQKGLVCPVGSANVIRSDGSQRLTTFDSWVGGVTFHWAENADLLFAAQLVLEKFPDTTQEPQDGMIQLRFALVDVPTGHTLFEVFESIPTEEHFTGSPVFVSRIGEQFITEYRLPVRGASRKVQRVFRVFSTDGTWYEVKRDGVPDHELRDYQPSSMGAWIVYSNGEYTYAENLLSRELMRFPQALNEFELSWSPNGQRALLWEKPRSQFATLWLLDLTTRRLSRMHHAVEPYEHLLAELQWSPDSSYFVYYAGPWTNRSVMLLDTLNLTIRRIRVPLSTSEYSVWTWWGMENQLGIRVSPDHYNYPDRYFLYTPATYLLSEATQSEVVYLDASLSPDGRRSAQGWVDYETIRDVRSGDVLRVRPPIVRDYGLFSDEFIWDAGSRWVLFSYEGDSGSYFNYFHTSVIDAENGTLRDLALYDKPIPHGADWLPPQVDPATLPPALEQAPFPRPDRILHGSEFVNALAWSPDSTRIADVSPFAGWGWGTRDSIAVWDMESGERVQRIIGVSGASHAITWKDGRVHLTNIFNPNFQRSGVRGTSPDGSLIAVLDGFELLVKDTATDEVVCILPNRVSHGVLFVTFAPNNQLVILQNEELWDVKTCRPLTWLPFRGAWDAEFSPDGRWLATAVSWDIQLWDVEKLLHPFLMSEGD